jgi:hypothetical protein
MKMDASLQGEDARKRQNPELVKGMLAFLSL